MSEPAELPLLVADTDAVSFVLKRDPVRMPRYVRHMHGRALVLPFSVVAELLQWAHLRRWSPRRRTELDDFLRRSRIEYPNETLCRLWAEIQVDARRAGRRIEHHDCWVAATALYLDAAVLTHNAGDYAGVPGLQIITEPDV